MAIGKLRAYYKSVRRAASALNSEASLKKVLDTIVRGIARTMEAGVSLVLLDSTGKKLIHSTSWGLPYSYLHKGVLDAEKSLAEVVTGQVVTLADVQKDSRIQYPDLAVKAGIVSILGVPLFVGGVPVGSIRVYTKEHHEFPNVDINFVTTMANLAATAIRNQELRKEKEAIQQRKGETEAQTTVLQEVQTAAFAHPSEQEFARLLDFYHIEWAYEPRSFPLKREGDKVMEMFTPDFYLPGLDLYVELITLKQSLVTEKNRKLRRLRELYPQIKITLLYKRDFERLLAKYGFGPLTAGERSVSRVLYSNTEIKKRVRELAEQISRDYADRHPVMVGVLRGVFCFMADLVREITVPLDVDFMAISYYTGGDGSAVKITKDIDLNVTGRHVIMVEDIVDTGMTLSYMLKHLKAREPASLVVCGLLDKRARRIVDVPLDYVGFEVPDEFVVGYGLDYKEEYRNLSFIGILGAEEVGEGSGKELLTLKKSAPNKKTPE